MMLRLGIPHGLELIGMELSSLPLIRDGFRGADGWDGTFAINPPITGNAFAGWSRATNFTSGGDLIIYTLRVREDAIMDFATAPITLAFANAMTPYFESPTDMNGNALEIALPGGVVGHGAVGNIGRVNIGTPTSELSVTATPNHQIIVNEIGHPQSTVSFAINITGMSQGVFCLAQPSCIPYNCLAYPTGGNASITISEIPEGIKAHGYVTVEASGYGFGVLNLTVYDDGVTDEFQGIVASLSEIFDVYSVFD